MSPYGILESQPHFRMVRLLFHRPGNQPNPTFFTALYLPTGVSSHEALSMWSGLTFSVTFLISAIVSPMWGSLADRKGRKLMLLRASLGMAIAILLQAFATNVWQLFLLRGVMGLTSGYIPNAMALVASQVPRERSGWALSTLSTAQISGVIGGPLMGALLPTTLAYGRYSVLPRLCW